MRVRPALSVLTAVLIGTGTAACTNEEPESEVVTIGVAAAPSLAESFSELISIFEAEHPGVRVSIELGKSTVIAEGLTSRQDINIFASASQEAMDHAVAAGVAVEPRLFAHNHVVMAVPSGNPENVRSLKDLERDDLEVGLCEVAVPCGQASEVLLSEAEITPVHVEYASGSRALTSQLADNDVGVGIVYRTDVASSHGWVTEVDVDARDRELQQAAGAVNYLLARVPGAIVSASEEGEATATEEFIELVLSDRGRLALNNSGLEAVEG
ncbi:MAG TPA: substrate-binding domain-containing protein [Candidatus Dietzia merdigallinarum]|nr:substrate-binding domain-containing protein [Candidatus Dietzia merdigallinarum]